MVTGIVFLYLVNYISNLSLKQAVLLAGQVILPVKQYSGRNGL
jgi:hypothetical protein